MPDPTNEVPGTGPSTHEQPTDDAPKTVPLSEHVALRKRAQASEARLAELEKAVKAQHDAEMSALEKAEAKAKELEPFRERYERSKAREEKRRDALLNSLADETKARVEPLLVRFDDPGDQAEVIEAFLAHGTPKQPTPEPDRSPPVRTVTDRGQPKTYAEWKALPRELRDKYRGLADKLP